MDTKLTPNRILPERVGTKLSLIVLEAFASGLPVISTPTGDIPSMVRHGETGVIVPPEAPVAMARAIADAINRTERALQMAEQAHRELDKYTWRAVRDQWNAVYRVLVRGMVLGVPIKASGSPDLTRNQEPEPSPQIPAPEPLSSPHST